MSVQRFQRMVVQADILIGAVLHAEAARHHAALHKAQPLVKMPAWILFSTTVLNCNSLKPKRGAWVRQSDTSLSPMCPPRQAEAIAQLAFAICPHRPTLLGCRINRRSVFFRNAAVGLGREKVRAGHFIQWFLLREGCALLHHLVPDAHHLRYVRFSVCSDLHTALLSNLCFCACYLKFFGLV